MSSFPALGDDNASTWRPIYHLIAPRGFMNDPCAPGYIPSTGTYHVGFQWNPNGPEWGDIVWGKAYSRDLVSWEVSKTPSLERDTSYDCAGVFTGCWGPTGSVEEQHEKEARPEELAVFYTSVSRVPIHYAAEYHVGSETLSLATSADGETWMKHEGNPILAGPPAGFDATGWRDPFVAPWPAMKTRLLTGSHTREAGDDVGGAETLFGIISGGVRDTSPTTWLYKINRSDLTSWEYIAPLFMPGLNFSPSRWTGDMGVNWEVTNFVCLGRDGRARPQEFLIFGAEGCKPPHGGAGVVPNTQRCNRAQLWAAVDGADENRQGEPLMKFSYGGIFDHGLLYAANGFWDPVSRQQVVFGWITEEDLPVEMQVEQGWSGCLSLPRTVSLAMIPHVSRASRSGLGEIDSIRARPETGGGDLFTVETLRVAPDARLQKLRSSAVRQDAAGGPLESGRCSYRLPLETAEWEALVQFCGVGSHGRVGVVIHHAPREQTTMLCFSPGDETFFIDRPDLCACMPSDPERAPAKLQRETAPFTLFTTRDPETGVELEERLEMHIFYDRSVLEVFVNERMVVTTRVYLEAAECVGMEFFAESAGVSLVHAAVWDGLRT